MKVLMMGSGFLPKDDVLSQDCVSDATSPAFRSRRVDFDFEAPDEGSDSYAETQAKKSDVSVNMLSKALDGIDNATLRPWTEQA